MPSARSSRVPWRAATSLLHHRSIGQRASRDRERDAAMSISDAVRATTTAVGRDPDVCLMETRLRVHPGYLVSRLPDVQTFRPISTNTAHFRTPFHLPSYHRRHPCKSLFRLLVFYR
jgi:hypothetical protein